MDRLDLLHPFTTAQALAAGIPASRLRGKEFRRLSKGRWVSAQRVPSATLDAEAALLGHPAGAFVSHSTAADLYGMPVPHDPVEHVSVFDRGHRRPRRGVHCHVAVTGVRVIDVDGVRVADPAHVFIQLAGALSLVDLVVVGDHIAGRNWYSAARLVQLCADSVEPHAGRALAAARYVRDRVDSPMETRLRMLLVLAGFPEPTVNLEIRSELGDVLVRFDLAFEAVQVAVEYDGRQHAESPRQHDRDIARREDVDSWDWRIVVITAKGVYTDPESTLRRVRAVLVARGLPGVPRRFDPQWRAHFPGRRRTGS
jgi:very-short-patch-repair endonuclease